MIRLLPLLALLAAGCASVPAASGPAPVAVTARPLALVAGDPSRATLGALRFLGGVELRSEDPRLGGFSSLKWRGGRLWAVTDTGDWASFAPVERRGALTGVADVRIGDLLGIDGRPLTGTATGDSEALAEEGGGWLVAFEHDHKILRYPRLGAPAEASGLDPQAIFGPLQPNNGVELLASRRGSLFLCAERLATAAAPNCYIRGAAGATPVPLSGPEGLDPATAFPVDASWASDGTLYILFRSWSGGADNRAAIVERSPQGATRTLALFVPPVLRDNWEGLALREAGGRRLLYVISDDNFHQYDVPERPGDWQRTMLLEFEVTGPRGR